MEAFGEILQTRLAFDGVTDRRSSHLLEGKGRNWEQGKEGNPLHDGMLFFDVSSVDVMLLTTKNGKTC